MKFLDFFAGVGGFRRGMELAGHECVGFCEFDKFAVASYTSMHLITEQQREYLSTLDLKQRQKEILKEEYRNGEWYANDIRRINADDIPDADCWCFGFPCQDISVAGKQLGFTGNRSSLFFRVMRLLGDLEEEKRPSYLFIENVKNLLSVNGGWDFARLLAEMDKVGYDAEWSVLNSKDFGVPQNRERCFVIGHFRGRGGSEVFPIERADGTNRVHGIGHRDGYRRNRQIFDTDGITEALDTGQGGGRGHHTIITLNKEFKHEHERVLDDGGIVGTLLARDYKDAKRVAIPVITPDRATKQQNGRRFKEDGEEAFTLTSQDRHGVAVEVREATSKGYAVARGRRDAVNFTMPNSTTRRGQVGVDIANTLDTSCNQGIFVQVSEDLTVYAVWYPKKQCYVAIRKLTPKECFRLQGWADDYFEKAQFVNSDSQLYKQAGNGVTVTVIEAIAERFEEVSP